MEETNVEIGMRRAAESWAKLTPKQKAHVQVLKDSVPERLANMLTGPPNAKGRQTWKWATPEAREKFTKQSQRIA